VTGATPTAVFLARRAAALALLLAISVACAPAPARAQEGPVRLVVLKFDGLPPSLVDRYVNTLDPRTGRSVVPWMKKLFYDEGVRLPNFYARGMSLSMPSWAIVDTGQHGVIKGNWEIDRRTGEPEDYLNLFDLHREAMRVRRAYPRSVEALDAARIPLLSDAFTFEERSAGIQLLRRGTMFNDFLDVGLHPVRGRIKERVGDFLTGLEWESAYDAATREDLVRAILNPSIRYVDYYNVYIDHLIHVDNDERQVLRALRQADRAIGEAYEAIVASGTVDRTVLAVVSDHGITFDDAGRFSHGLNLVPYLTSREFGAHNVLSRRGQLPGYTLQGSIFKPIPPTSVVDTSRDTYFLSGRSSQATCAIDNDGNERVQVHLRAADLNRLQMLRYALKDRALDDLRRGAVGRATLRIVDRNRAGWLREAREIREELAAIAAVRRRHVAEIEPLARMNARNRDLAKRKRTAPPAPLAPARRTSSINTSDPVRDADQREKELRSAVWRLDQLGSGYERYCASLELRASIRSVADLLAAKDEALFNDRDLGTNLAAGDLRAYPAGLREIVVDAAGEVDEARSFVTVDYVRAFGNLRVANTVYPEFDSKPIDFGVMRLPAAETCAAAVNAGLLPAADAPGVTTALLLFRSDADQLLYLEKSGAGSDSSIALLPATVTVDPASGALAVAGSGWRPGLPLGLSEDPNLAIEGADRSAWLSSFHTEREWLDAAHRTRLGLGVVGLSEVFSLDFVPAFETAMRSDATPEDRLVRRFELRRRLAMETDLLLHASPHWHFQVKDFNAGGNHGGFSRQSMHAVFWLTGGRGTRIPKGPLVVERAFDGLDVAPTLLEAAGITSAGSLPEALVRGGFRPFPGRVAYEALNPQPR
jgi:hypothetical protein